MKYKRMTIKELRAELAMLRGQLFRSEMNDGNIYKQHRLSNKIKEVEAIIDIKMGRQ